MPHPTSPAPACPWTAGSWPDAGAAVPPDDRVLSPDPALAIALGLVVVANLPFGYWRAGLAKRSLPWIVAIHAPIPLVWLIRGLLGLEWRLATLPMFVGAYFLGQWLGGRLRRRRASGTGVH